MHVYYRHSLAGYHQLGAYCDGQNLPKYHESLPVREPTWVHVGPCFGVRIFIIHNVHISIPESEGISASQMAPCLASQTTEKGVRGSQLESFRFL